MRKLFCPHCKSAAHIRTSRAISALTREIRLQCTNVECGHTFIAMLETVRTIRPSGMPDPLIAQQLSGELPERDAPQYRPSLPALTT